MKTWTNKTLESKHIAVRLPNWLGDLVMTLPFIQALRKEFPKSSLTLIAQKHCIPLLEKLNLADHYLALPPKTWNYFWKIFKRRTHAFDHYFLFTQSTRSDLEALILCGKERYGISRKNKRRPLLNKPWMLPSTINENDLHQTKLWALAFKHFGIQQAIDIQPFTLQESKKQDTHQKTLGLIAGTENTPQKRWPIYHWQRLIETVTNNHPDVVIKLLGTHKDADITTQIAKDFDSNRVKDLAGKTNLIDFMHELAQCDLIICNDTGGMHLANMIGRPLISLFGPTNPIRTGPIYPGNSIIMQPPGSPKTGPAPIEAILPEIVYQKTIPFLNQAL